MTTPKANPVAPASTAADLDRKYGQIGISAVAAAMRYQSEPKKQDDGVSLETLRRIWAADEAA